LVAKFRRPKISDVIAGTTPWNPPKAKPLRREATPRISGDWTAFSKAANRVRPLRNTRLVVRGMERFRISLSGMNLQQAGSKVGSIKK
jgi:hypothetical protein